jgi:hypothetical protein
MIQHRDELAFLFCGVQTLDELGPDWSNYFISVRTIEMLYLERDEAEHLITRPVPDFKLQYDNGVVPRILDETRCQPCLLQLIGEAMVKQANRERTTRLTHRLLDAALDMVLAPNNTIYFSNQWHEPTGLTPEERAIGQRTLSAIAHARPVAHADDPETQRVLRRLQRYHVIEPWNGGYRCEIPLMARWVREHVRLET